MKKRMKIAQIVTMHSALMALSDTPLPARLAADVSVLLGQVGEVLNKASQAHIGLYAIHGVQAGDQMVIPEANLQAFSDANTEIVSAEVTIDVGRIRMSSFAGAHIKPSVLMALGPLFIDDEPNQD